MDRMPWESSVHRASPIPEPGLYLAVWTQAGSSHLQHRATSTHLVWGQAMGVHQLSTSKEEEKGRY